MLMKMKMLLILVIIFRLFDKIKIIDIDIDLFNDILKDEIFEFLIELIDTFEKIEGVDLGEDVLFGKDLGVEFLYYGLIWHVFKSVKIVVFFYVKWVYTKTSMV
jgi:hypothetical protein